MDLNSGMRLLFLGLLLAAITVGTFPVWRRNRALARQQMLLWIVLFGAVAAGFNFLQNREAGTWLTQSVSGETVILPKQADGHFYATLLVNGVEIDFVVDTGASDIVLTPADAARAGIDTDQLVYNYTAQTANGEAAAAAVRLSRVSLGPREDSNLRAMVAGDGLHQSLLGMSYLTRWTKLEMTATTVTLTP